jgi:hypothetical protein
VRLDWIYGFDHLVLLRIWFLLVLVVRGLDRLLDVYCGDV